MSRKVCAVHQTAQGMNRFESKGIEFHQQVRSAFLDLAGRYHDRFVVIDAGRSADTIAADIADIVMPRLAAAQLV